MAGAEETLHGKAYSVNATMNATHDPQRQSWVLSANRPGNAFPIQNLPFGVFAGASGPAIGVAIGDQVLDLRGCSGLLGPLPAGIAEACAASTLNPLMTLGPGCWSALRARLSDLLRSDHPQAADHQQALRPKLAALAEVTMLKPAVIGDYTDFYASIDHARNVGRLFRPDNALLPNYKYVPIGYHGRASSIVLSGSTVKRPKGQIVSSPGSAPRFAPCQALDYEIEVGFFVGAGNGMGERIGIEDAASHLFGVCLLNDWTARDIQAWEYQPLGPFLAKSFATSISPWIVTMEALAPFRTGAYARPAQDPAPLAYLASEKDMREGGIDLCVEVYLRSARMDEGIRVSRSNLQNLYWTPAQLVTHHASNGCNLQPGDLLGSGTVSGPEEENLGCLLELTRNGLEPVSLTQDESRGFLEDGDEVVFRGYCARDGFVGIGLGECRGSVVGGE
ncbi:MAG: fumarylacetoacetase [Acidobacteriaceae bacterium]|jgi:fumarylacetoacetase|nr:fumarylacetoacetase [Acidobacteriaceae bacterium]